MGWYIFFLIIRDTISDFAFTRKGAQTENVQRKLHRMLILPNEYSVTRTPMKIRPSQEANYATWTHQVNLFSSY